MAAILNSIILAITIRTAFGVSGQSTTTDKAGVAVQVYDVQCKDINDNSNYDSLNNAAIGWYYNWQRYSKFDEDHDPIKPSSWFLDCNPLPTKEFVPMIWAIPSGHITNNKIDEDYIDTTDTTYLLGFNEPNRDKQANIYPDVAAQYWKDYVIEYWGANSSNSMKLVSPCPHNCPCPTPVPTPSACPLPDDGGNCLDTRYRDRDNWFDDFFSNFSGSTLAERITKSEIQYMAVHAYSCDVDDVMNDLQTLYNKYGLKIWLTEFACNFGGTKSVQDIQDYLDEDEMIKKLEQASYIFRYSFYRSRREPTETSDYRSLLEDDMETVSLSGVGDTYIAEIEEWGSC